MKTIIELLATLGINPKFKIHDLVYTTHPTSLWTVKEIQLGFFTYNYLVIGHNKEPMVVCSRDLGKLPFAIGETIYHHGVKLRVVSYCALTFNNYITINCEKLTLKDTVFKKNPKEVLTYNI